MTSSSGGAPRDSASRMSRKPRVMKVMEKLPLRSISGDGPRLETRPYEKSRGYRRSSHGAADARKKNTAPNILYSR